MHSLILSPDNSRGDHRRLVHHHERLRPTPATVLRVDRSGDRRQPALQRQRPGPQRRAPTPRSPACRTDGDSLYVSGYVFGAGGNLEGIARVDWATTNIVWVEDCHGDTYGSFPKGDVIYAASHAHYCGNLPGGFPQTDPLDPALRHRVHQGGHRDADRRSARLPQLGGQPVAVAAEVVPAAAQRHLHRPGPGRLERRRQQRLRRIRRRVPDRRRRAQQGLVRYAVQ